MEKWESPWNNNGKQIRDLVSNDVSENHVTADLDRICRQKTAFLPCLLRPSSPTSHSSWAHKKPVNSTASKAYK